MTAPARTFAPSGSEQAQGCATALDPGEEPSLARVIALDPEGPGRLAAPHRLAALVAAVERGRAPVPDRLTGVNGLAVLHQAELRSALRSGALQQAEDAAVALWRRHGLARVHSLVEAVLRAVSVERADGTVDLVAERLVLATADRLVARLHARSAEPCGDLVVVVATDGFGPAGVIGRARAHQLEDAGWAAVVASPADAARMSGSDRVAAVVQPGDDLVEVLGALRRGPLTRREAEVLGCLAEGLTNAEAAQRLGVSAATVRSHLDRVFVKTGTTHRAAAVAMALRHGWFA